MERNRLDQSTSPYLLLHRDNPVHWQPWSTEALAQAKRENKPILLSSGYSACHWCHVMARESFENPEIAELMNRLFVNIKVDREERPDIDTIYQTVLAEMGQLRGWPLTMFLTPDGEPFAGGTYFPPTAGYGRPAFRDVLQSTAASYASDPETAAATASRLIAGLKGAARKAGGEISPALRNHVANQLLDNVDRVYGGIGQEAKFPQPMLQELLWRAYCRTGHKSFRQAVELSVGHMCSGGLFDHLGGGFARYCVDDRWLVPHFEKMLCDNALLIDLLTTLWQATGNLLFAQSVDETVSWALREMQLPDGGFCSSLAADSRGHGNIDAGEGAFYLWQEAEIDAVLGDEAPLFKSYYDVDYYGNWDGMTILNRLDRPMSRDLDLEERLTALRAKLWAVRETRPKPERDDKVLADWNGHMIAALARAGRAFDHPVWIEAAAQAFTFVRDNLGNDGRLRHSFHAGQAAAIAFLDDYAAMARAALSLFEIRGDPQDLRQAMTWVATADRYYWDQEGGGYFFTADDAEAVVLRNKSAQETAAPSGNATMVGVLARLHATTGEGGYRERARATVAAFAAEVPSDFIGMAALNNNSEQLDDLVQVVVIGDPASGETQDLIRVANGVSPLDRIVLQVSPGASLPAGHPADGKIQIDGKTTAYVCRGSTCQLPITEPSLLRAALEQV
jgi:uncharacterized protein YyaL (SSP411 family)